MFRHHLIIVRWHIIFRELLLLNACLCCSQNNCLNDPSGNWSSTIFERSWWRSSSTVTSLLFVEASIFFFRLSRLRSMEVTRVRSDTIRFFFWGVVWNLKLVCDYLCTYVLLGLMLQTSASEYTFYKGMRHMRHTLNTFHLELTSHMMLCIWCRGESHYSV